MVQRYANAIPRLRERDRGPNRRSCIDFRIQIAKREMLFFAERK